MALRVLKHSWISAVVFLSLQQQLAFDVRAEDTCTACPSGSSPYNNGASCCSSGTDLLDNPIHYTSTTCGDEEVEEVSCPDSSTCCDETCTSEAVDGPNCTQCPCGTYAFFDGSYCCRQNNDGNDNPISYTSLTCNNNDQLACPSGNSPGSCCDNNALVPGNECGNCPDGTTAYANGSYCCRGDRDVWNNTLEYTSINCWDNDFVTCPAGNGVCCDTTTSNEPLVLSVEVMPVGQPIVAFSDESSNQEIVMNYNTSARPIDVRLFTGDCVTPISNGAITANSEVVPGNTSGYQDVQVKLDIDTAIIATSSSSIWSQSTDSSTGYIQFCVQMNVMYETTSLNFHETKLALTIAMANSFEVTSLATDRDDAEINNLEAELDYFVEAYQCTPGGDRLATTLSQGSILTVCIETNATDVRLGSILYLSLDQIGSDAVATPINNGVTDGLTSALPCVGNKCIVRTMMLSSFFGQGTTNPVTVSGTAVFAFGSNSRHLLLSTDAQQQDELVRTLAEKNNDEDTKTSPFTTEVSLISTDMSDPVSTNTTPKTGQENLLKQSILTFLMTMAACAVVIAVSVVAFSRLIRYKEKDIDWSTLSGDDSYVENIWFAKPRLS